MKLVKMAYRLRPLILISSVLPAVMRLRRGSWDISRVSDSWLRLSMQAEHSMTGFENGVSSAALPEAEIQEVTPSPGQALSLKYSARGDRPATVLAMRKESVTAAMENLRAALPIMP